MNDLVKPPEVSAPGTIPVRTNYVEMLEPLTRAGRRIHEWERERQRVQCLNTFSVKAPVPDNVLTRCRNRMRILPSFEVCQAAVEEFHTVLTTAADETQVRFLVGLMIDGLGLKVTESSATRLDALVFVVVDDDIDSNEWSGASPKPFSAEVLAWAVRRVWRSCRFPPTPAEFLAIAKAVRKEFGEAYDLAHKIHGLVWNAEEVLLEHELVSRGATPQEGSDDDIPF